MENEREEWLTCWCCECKFGKDSDCDYTWSSEYNHTDPPQPFCGYCHDGSKEVANGEDNPTPTQERNLNENRMRTAEEIKCELCGETENLIKVDNEYLTWVCETCEETKLGDKSGGYCSDYCKQSGHCDGNC